MANGWTQERKARQAARIRGWRPWEKSTGPRTPNGKAKVSRNAYKGGTCRSLKELRRALRGGVRELFRQQGVVEVNVDGADVMAVDAGVGHRVLVDRPVPDRPLISGKRPAPPVSDDGSLARVGDRQSRTGNRHDIISVTPKTQPNLGNYALEKVTSGAHICR